MTAPGEGDLPDVCTLSASDFFECAEVCQQQAQLQ